MKLKSFFVFTLILFVPLLNACSDDTHEFGNSIGNTLNMGMVASDDEWIYFTYAPESGSIYKMRHDMSSITKLYDGVAYYLNVIDDWLYFMDYTGGMTITRMLTDGTKQQRISEYMGHEILVVDDTVYFTMAKTKTSLQGEVCYIKTNGEGFTRAVISQSFNTCFYDKYIYYIDTNQGFNICRKSKGGVLKSSKTETVYSGSVSWFNINENGIYFTKNDSNGIYHFDNNGKETTIISSSVMSPCLYENNIFYCNVNENMALYKLDVFSYETTELVDSLPCSMINATEGYVYFTTSPENPEFYRVSVNGGEAEKIVIN